jgi:hypothetical protein
LDFSQHDEDFQFGEIPFSIHSAKALTLEEIVEDYNPGTKKIAHISSCLLNRQNLTNVPCVFYS